MIVGAAVNFQYLAERLTAERRKRGWTQAEVARRIQVSQPKLSNMETGKSVDWQAVQRLCALYDLKPEDVIGRVFGMKSALEEAIENAPEIGSSDRSLLLSMYRFMRDRGPLAEAASA